MLRRQWFGRAFTFLAAAAGLAACVAESGGVGYGRPAPFSAGPGTAVVPQQSAGGSGIAILLPLTGSNAEVGQTLLRAAQLSFDRPGAPPIDARDTGGTPEGAAEATRQALAGGVRLILGPLTAGETAAVAPVAKAAGIPVLAFTSDASQARPAIWTLGVTPAQQVRRLVLAVQAEGKTRVGAVLPQNAFGDALATGLANAASAASLTEPRILRFGSSFSSLDAALKDISGYNNRRGAIEQQQQAARARGDADGRRNVAEIGRQNPPSAPIDALLLAVAGDQLGQAVPLLTFYDISPDQVRIVGPAYWARETSRLVAVPGVWYAAPDPAQRASFGQQYSAKYGAPPRELSSLAFDAAGVARIVSDSGFTPDALTRPEGFAGADGVFALQPDGQVRRGLAIFEVGRNGSRIVQPAPQSLSAPGV